MPGPLKFPTSTSPLPDGDEAARICGECRLCCWVFPVPALGKPAAEWCRFADARGCSIHDTPRPPVCTEYDCYWRDHEELSDELRPDRIGIVVTDCGHVAVGGEWLSILLFNQTHPEAAQGAARALLDSMVARGKVVLLIHDSDMEILYDHVRYASLAPHDIETAYREELSRKAEELKQLGAVEAKAEGGRWMAEG
jgi:Fe-S-cluster containining protein